MLGVFACGGGQDPNEIVDGVTGGAPGVGGDATGGILGESTGGLVGQDPAGGASGTGGAASGGGTGGAHDVDECSEGEPCGDGCVDTSSSGEHCGGCDRPCDGICSGGVCQPEPSVCPSVTDPDVEVRLVNDTWNIEGLGGNPETRDNIKDAIERAFARLAQGRTVKQSVVVHGSGSIGQNQRIQIPSYTVLDVCGTIDVTSTGGSGDFAPFYASGATDIEIPHASVTGVPYYGMFFRRVNNLHLGQIELRLTSGLGIRIDNQPGASNNWGRTSRVTNVRLDDVFVSGSSAQAVETYGVDGLLVGTVTARDVGESGLLLNATVNAEIGVVDAEDTGAGTGYAAFRIANEAGRIGQDWITGNIHVGQVRARRGGRGIFCVSDSGGLTVDRIDLADTNNNSILLENCHNTQIAAIGGTVSGGGEIRISQRADEHTPTSNITLQNLTVTGTSVRESPCAQNTVVCNLTTTGQVALCSGSTVAACP